MDALFEYLLRALVYGLRVIMRWPSVISAGQWLLANATVTTPPRSSEGIACRTVEIVYAFRVKDELYTGLHEEPFLSTESLTDYIERFGEGRHVIVRVKPGNPEVSVVREEDQGALSQSQLERLTS
jgi:hypothetical protein